MKNHAFSIISGVLLIALLAVAGCVGEAGPTAAQTAEQKEMTLTDGYGRTVTIPQSVESVLCSGSGTLRYLVYLQGENLVAGVDSIEKQHRDEEGRPYALVHRSWLKDLPLFGEFRGKDDPEKIIAIGPDLVFKGGSSGTAYGTSIAEIDDLESKTGVPVVGFAYGSLRNEAEKTEMYTALRVMGKTIGHDARAEEVIAYIEATIADLEARTGDISPEERKRVYVGGVSYAGAQGIISTEPAYSPFLWVHADNVASGLGTAHADVAKEAIVDWDPDYIFIDAGTTRMDNEGAVGQLRNDPALQGLSAVKEGRVYGVLPYNFYNTNYETVLANAYSIGKVLYPDRFADIDPAEKAEEIMTFFIGEPVFSELNSQFNDFGFRPVSL
ncbi:MAG: ABC-type transporter, periplasmic subunit [Methanomicrobiales archaeon 53_19]|jgi:iron complex transport system substrate-binding protein|uniref:iron ABC transporter substrate-binding protein n=1 Tax=Methanocalculus sp. TaxID=2004547 RepID=UPI0007463495|nr:iron ABC transporter substrate-binding protein [Methanocalculus sp.]KUK68126.1 MAG: ABC-type transporter, periplasmic subunit [Methanocalculus sp. 52_23]KUL02286.1 MAG: ABC-type transporter, periplasmic subunit [Methanomicrobiales archaeon 53_19]HIJ07249.1 iron ABC transporter substrate-binding protein [Methanocalculus sp.]